MVYNVGTVGKSGAKWEVLEAKHSKIVLEWDNSNKSSI